MSLNGGEHSTCSSFLSAEGFTSVTVMLVGAKVVVKRESGGGGGGAAVVFALTKDDKGGVNVDVLEVEVTRLNRRRSHVFFLGSKE